MSTHIMNPCIASSSALPVLFGQSSPDLPTDPKRIRPLMPNTSAPTPILNLRPLMPTSATFGPIPSRPTSVSSLISHFESRYISTFTPALAVSPTPSPAHSYRSAVTLPETAHPVPALAHLPSTQSSPNPKPAPFMPFRSVLSPMQSQTQPNAPTLLLDNQIPTLAAGAQPTARSQKQGIWSGAVEFEERPTPLWSYTLDCDVIGNVINGKPEINSDEWPEKLFMSVVPKHVINRLLPRLKRTNILKLNFRHDISGQGLPKLRKIMANNWVGCIQLSQSPVLLILVMYLAPNQSFMAYVAQDPTQASCNVRERIDSYWKVRQYLRETSDLEELEDTEEILLNRIGVKASHVGPTRKRKHTAGGEDSANKHMNYIFHNRGDYYRQIGRQFLESSLEQQISNVRAAMTSTAYTSTGSARSRSPDMPFPATIVPLLTPLSFSNFNRYTDSGISNSNSRQTLDNSLNFIINSRIEANMNPTNSSGRGSCGSTTPAPPVRQNSLQQLLSSPQTYDSFVEEQRRLLSRYSRSVSAPADIDSERIVMNDFTFKCFPKFKVIKPLLETKTIGALSDTGVEIEFNLKLLELEPNYFMNTNVYKDLKCYLKQNSLQIQLRFSYISDCKAKQLKDLIPEFLCIDCNSSRVFTYTENLERNRPFDLSDLCEFGKNKIRFSMSKPNYTFLMPCAYELSIVSFETSDSFLNKLKLNSNQFLSSDSTKQLIKSRNEVQTQDEENEICLTNTDIKVTLNCPLSCRRIETPCRTYQCTHIECFDAQSFLKTNEWRYVWFCPICQKSAQFESLCIDGYFANILSETDENITEICINSDASYHVMNTITQEVVEVDDTGDQYECSSTPPITIKVEPQELSVL